ncbi:MAG: hypothetical protein MOGMAGMI_00509 [Candidatus Omnitrophica bacterium]|nr:hypothetical protein [Candidatus Omnitrophota bacterium]
MPFTPYHFGPCACVAIPLRRHIDLPVLLLTNVVVDVEPLTIEVLRLPLLAHGLLHSFAVSTFLGLGLAAVCWRGRRGLARAMRAVRYPYETSALKMLMSAVGGMWLHVLIDAPLYTDIRPFLPSMLNPLYGLYTYDTAALLCALCYIPALWLYLRCRTPKNPRS